MGGNFFALANTQVNENIAIYRIKKINEQFNPFGYRIHFSNFNFQKNDSRHERQSSSYMLGIFQNDVDDKLPKEKRVGPYFLLSDFELQEWKEINIEKYVIIDSGDNRLKFLSELYEQNYSFEEIYGNTHLFENTLLKDMAVKEILLSNVNNG